MWAHLRFSPVLHGYYRPEHYDNPGDNQDGDRQINKANSDQTNHEQWEQQYCTDKLCNPPCQFQSQHKEFPRHPSQCYKENDRQHIRHPPLTVITQHRIPDCEATCLFRTRRLQRKQYTLRPLRPESVPSADDPGLRRYRFPYSGISPSSACRHT